MKGGSFYTFWKTDYPFMDVDAGDWLTAVKVTSLPAHGTLRLGGTLITTVPSALILAGNTNTLTYTPNTSYFGADSFKYQVRDASLFSTDATMAITVTPNIMVLNGNFETAGTVTDTNWAHIASVWQPSPDSNYGQSHSAAAFASAADGIW